MMHDDDDKTDQVRNYNSKLFVVYNIFIILRHSIPIK